MFWQNDLSENEKNTENLQKEIIALQVRLNILVDDKI